MTLPTVTAVAEALVRAPVPEPVPAGRRRLRQTLATAAPTGPRCGLGGAAAAAAALASESRVRGPPPSRRLPKVAATTAVLSLRNLAAFRENMLVAATAPTTVVTEETSRW